MEACEVDVIMDWSKIKKGCMITLAGLLLLITVVGATALENIDYEDLNNPKIFADNLFGLEGETYIDNDNICFTQYNNFKIITSPCNVTRSSSTYITQYVDFIWEGATTQYLDFYFLFENGLEDGRIYTETLQDEGRLREIQNDTSVREVLLTGVLSIEDSNSSCDMGNENNPNKKKIVFDRKNQTVCYINATNKGNGTYKGFQYYNSHEKYRVNVPRWVDRTSLMTNLGANRLATPDDDNFHYFKVTNAVTFSPGEHIKTKLVYTPKDRVSSGKWHIFGKRSGDSLQEAKNSGLYVYQDPQWQVANSSLGIDINETSGGDVDYKYMIEVPLWQFKQNATNITSDAEYCYHLDGDATDDCTGDDNGTVNNAVSGYPSVPMSDFGTAYYFDGVDDDITLSATGNQCKAMTRCVWMLPELSPDDGVYVWGGQAGGHEKMQIGHAADNVVCRFYDGSTEHTLTASNAGINHHKWVHFCCVHDDPNNYVIAYIDGMQVGNLSTGAISDDNAACDTGQQIGGYHGNSAEDYKGLLDEFLFFNDILNSSEISHLYEQSSWKFENFTWNETDWYDNTYELGEEAVNVNHWNQEPPETGNATGHWRFNGDFLDETGMCNLTNVGTQTSDSLPEFNSAREYIEAQTDYAHCLHTDRFNAAGGSFTWSAWILGHDFAAYHTIMNKCGTDDGACTGSDGFEMITWSDGDGNGKFGVLDGAGWGCQVGEFIMKPGRWHLVTTTWDGTTSKCFVDGVLEGTSATNMAWTNTQDELEIGKNYQGTNNARKYWDGYIDEVQIWNYSLTDQQVAELVTPDYMRVWNANLSANTTSVESNGTYDHNDSGIELFVRFNEGFGTNISDFDALGDTIEEGSAHNTEWTTNTANACHDYAMQFRGTGDSWVSFDSVPDALEGSGAFSVTVWFYQNSTPGDCAGINPLVTVGNNAANARWALIACRDSSGECSCTDNNAQRFTMDFYTVGAHATNSASYAENTWVHGAAVYNTSHVLYYINGSFVEAVAFSTANIGSTDMGIGGRPGILTQEYRGSIGETRIYDRALSADEIGAIYNKDACLQYTVGGEHAHPPPTTATVSITPTTLYPSIDARGICNATETDGDVITYHARWYINNTLNETSSKRGSEGEDINVHNLSNAYFDYTDALILECRADDGTSNSTWMNSSSNTVSSLQVDNVLYYYNRTNSSHVLDDSKKHNATMNGTVYVEGNYFNTSLGYWSIETLTPLDTDDWTIAAWINRSSDWSKRSGLMGMWGSWISNGGWTIGIAGDAASDTLVTRWKDQGGTENKAPADNTYYPIDSGLESYVWSRNGTKINFYINGTFHSSATIDSTDNFSDSTTQTTYFATGWESKGVADTWHYSSFHGWMGGIGIWNRSFSSAAVDEYHNSGTINDIYKIQNNLPTVTNVNITPATAYTKTNLTGAGTYADADGDAESGTVYAWYRNNSVITGQTTTSLNDTSFGATDTIIFEYKPKDGTSFGTPVNSSTLTISNTVPTFDFTNITSEESETVGYTNDTLRVNVTNTADADGDVFDVIVEWFKNSVSWFIQIFKSKSAGYVAISNLTSGNFSKDDNITVGVSINDSTLFTGFEGDPDVVAYWDFDLDPTLEGTVYDDNLLAYFDFDDNINDITGQYGAMQNKGCTYSSVQENNGIHCEPGQYLNLSSGLRNAMHGVTALSIVGWTKAESEKSGGSSRLFNDLGSTSDSEHYRTSGLGSTYIEAFLSSRTGPHTPSGNPQDLHFWAITNEGGANNYKWWYNTSNWHNATGVTTSLPSVATLSRDHSTAGNNTFDEVAIFSKALSSSDVSALHGGLYWIDAPLQDGTRGYNLTNNGANMTTGHTGQAFSFDRSNDYLDAGITDVTFNDSFTFAAWFKTDCTGTCALVDGDGVNSNELWIRIEAASTRIRALLEDDGGTNCIAISGDDYNDDAWHHLVYTYNGSDCYLYIDGGQDGTASASLGAVTFATEFHIGQLNGASNFGGELDNVVVYNKSLSAADVLRLYNSSQKIGAMEYLKAPENTTTLQISNLAPTSATPILNSTSATNKTDENLTVYPQTVADLDGDNVKNITVWEVNKTNLTAVVLPFEGGSNATWTRNYANGSNATVTNAVWNSTRGYDGNGVYEFNGNSAIDSNFDPGTVYTLSAWAFVPTYSTQGNVFGVRDSSGSAGTREFYFHHNGAHTMVLHYYDCSNGNKGTITANNVTDNMWHHFAITRNGDSVELFVDGISNGSDSTSGKCNPTRDVFIGRLGEQGIQYWQDRIDDVVFSDSVFTDSQIWALYTNRTDLIVDDMLGATDVWEAYVTPNDGTEDGTTQTSNSITMILANTAPTVENVSITPATAYTNSSLNGTGDYRDTDGDAESGSTYKWFVNNTVIAGQVAVTLNNTQFAKTDTIIFEYTPNDGTTAGTAVNSSGLTISNYPAIVATSTITPATIPTNTSAKGSCNATDIDGDTIQFFYKWFINNTVNETGTRTGQTEGEVYNVHNLSNTYYAETDVLLFECLADDGTDNSTVALNSSSKTISNSVPETATVTITPATLYTNDTALGNCNVTDNDGEQLNYHYRWFINNTLNETGSRLSQSEGEVINVNNLSSAFFAKTDVLIFECIADDNTSNSTRTNSSGKTVSDIAPVTRTTTITPATLYTNNTALGNCNVTDEDGDTLIFHYRWFINNTLNETGSRMSQTEGEVINVNNLSSAYYAKTDTIIFECRADDNTSNSTRTNSTGKTVSDIAPVTRTVTITPTTIPTNTSAKGNCNVTDEDADTLIFHYRWFINNTINETGSRMAQTEGEVINVNNLSNTYYAETDVLIFECRADDNTTNSTRTNSSSKTISNSVPETATVTITPTTIYTNTTVLGNCNVTDNDGENLNFHYKWYINTTLNETGSRLSQTEGEVINVNNLSTSFFKKGSTLIFECVADDNTSNSTKTNSSASSTILNLAPDSQTLNDKTKHHNDSLSVDVNCTDVDGDTLTYYVNDTMVSINSASGLITDNPAYTDEGSHNISVYCDDGTVNATTMTFLYTVQNHPPRVTTRIDPSSATIAHDLIGKANGTDNSSDNLTYHWRWYLNGSLNGSGVTTSTYVSGVERSLNTKDSSNTYKNQVYIFSSMVEDDMYNSSWVNSSSVTIGASVQQGGGSGGTPTGTEIIVLSKSCNLELSTSSVELSDDQLSVEIELTNKEDFSIQPNFQFADVVETNGVSGFLRLDNVDNEIDSAQTGKVSISYNTMLLGSSPVKDGFAELIMSDSGDRCNDVVIPIEVNIKSNMSKLVATLDEIGLGDLVNGGAFIDKVYTLMSDPIYNGVSWAKIWMLVLLMGAIYGLLLWDLKWSDNKIASGVSKSVAWLLLVFVSSGAFLVGMRLLLG